MHIHPKILGLITHITKYKYNLNFEYITYIAVTYQKEKNATYIHIIYSQLPAKYDLKTKP